MNGPVVRGFKNVGNGGFSYEEHYAGGFALVERAFLECGVTVTERSPEKGVVAGASKRPKLTLTAVFFSSGKTTRVDVTAFIPTHTLDFSGACSKKVDQVVSRVADLVSTVESHPNAFTEIIPGGLLNTSFVAPSYENRGGPNYYDKAVWGICFSLGGLIVGPAAVLGLVSSCGALMGMSTSNNKTGYNVAMTGAVIGAFALIGWVTILMSYLQE